MSRLAGVYTLLVVSCYSLGPDWITKSNQHAQILLNVLARFNPESAAALGIDGLDERIFDLQLNLTERRQKAVRQALGELKSHLAVEKDPLVQQDLEILIRSAQDDIRTTELNQKYRFPYFSMSQAIFSGVISLLDDRIPPERRKAAVVRLRRYAGMEEGYTPIATLAEQRVRERMAIPELMGPPKAQVEKDLENSGFFIRGIAQLCQKYKLEGWQDAHARLKEQLGGWDAFVRKEVLPRARTDFRLPAELYNNGLQGYGVDIPAPEVAGMAHHAFTEVQSEMQKVAAMVAKEKGYSSSDYRDVIRELKKEQLAGDQIMAHYQQRIAEIEDVVRREKLVSLPARPARVRLATEAESAQQPAPHMRPPRLLGNTGESGEFVLPLVTPSAKGEDKKMDDFTYAAASYTLAAHEARPGHEMQFSAMVEHGVSTARAVYAFNSVNVEGWGLYAERIMLPYMPPEAKLVSLNMRLLRAARAFLDPELHLGRITPEQAYKTLREDVLQSDAMATQEVERYTFRAPGQATSYFYGFVKLKRAAGRGGEDIGTEV